MEQLNEIRAMNEGLGDLTDNLNPEFFGSYPVNTTLAPQDAYGRRRLNVFNLTDVDGRALITDGRPNPGFELLYAAHAEMAAVVSISSRGINRGDFRMESFWVSRHGIARSRFATLPESDDGILWLSPFERLVPEVFEIAALGNSTFVPDGLRAPVKRDEVKPHRPMAQQTAAIAKAIRKEWPDAAREIEAGNVREVTLHVTSVNKYGVHENENSWFVTPVGALMILFEKERMLRADTFVTGMSLYELRREIDDLLPGEADRRDWEQLAEQTGAVRIDTSIPA